MERESRSALDKDLKLTIASFANIPLGDPDKGVDLSFIKDEAAIIAADEKRQLDERKQAHTEQMDGLRLSFDKSKATNDLTLAKAKLEQEKKQAEATQQIEERKLAEQQIEHRDANAIELEKLNTDNERLELDRAKYNHEFEYENNQIKLENRKCDLQRWSIIASVVTASLTTVGGIIVALIKASADNKAHKMSYNLALSAQRHAYSDSILEPGMSTVERNRLMNTK